MEASTKDKKTYNFIDAHVHIYKCFDLKVFFTKAFENIQRAAVEMTHNGDINGILYLADTRGSNWFNFLFEEVTSKKANIEPLSTFKFTTTLEPHSIEVQSPDHTTMFIIASQQIITAENLEVLALGMKERLPDGLPISEVLEEVQASGALVTLPWGVGKWLGRRGKVIRKIVVSHLNRNFSMFLGDIAGRPWFWPFSSMTNFASSHGYQLLSGTDPLPLATEETRVGAYGSLLKGEISSEHPAESLKQLLQSSAITLQQYGQNENIYRFLRNQILLRLK